MVECAYLLASVLSFFPLKRKIESSRFVPIPHSCDVTDVPPRFRTFWHLKQKRND